MPSYQARVTQGAKEVPGYTLVLGTTNPQTIDIVAEEGNTAVNNVKIFYYVEDTVDIKYEVVGPDGCGTLDNYQNNTVKVIDGTPGDCHAYRERRIQVRRLVQG